MGMISTQTIVTAQAKGLAAAAAALSREVENFPHARVVSLVQQTTFMNSFRGETTIVAIVDHD
jgi:hypothetical protein